MSELFSSDLKRQVVQLRAERDRLAERLRVAECAFSDLCAEWVQERDELRAEVSRCKAVIREHELRITTPSGDRHE